MLESTTYPGTTRERVVPILEESGLAAGRDFHVAFSPERMSIDIWEVVDAAATKPYGFMRFDPGPGMGGHCPLVGDIRESPALKILTLLSALGAELRYHDPHVPTLADHGLSSVTLEEALQDADLAPIVTAHPGVDHEMVLTHERLVVDLRGINRGSLVENVVRL